MTASWTFAVYMAGDNDLETFGLTDLAEMKRAGSTPELNIVAQFDRMSSGQTRRYYLRRGTGLTADCVAELGETNCGDPAILVDFATWAIANYPAQRYCLVLWNHGSGWKEDDVYRMGRVLGLTDRELPKTHLRALSGRGVRRAFFSSTVDILLQVSPGRRAICFDDQSEDFLDNAELKRALGSALAQAGAGRIDVLGMDACLMNMLEVAYQVHGQCGYLVGSQEIEPGEGWPYHTILRRLRDHPETTPRELSELIVRKYVDYYRRNTPDAAVTQSSLDLACSHELVGKVDALAATLLPLLEQDAVYLDLLFAARRAQKFRDADYIDLGHFAGLLAARTANPAIAVAARVVEEAVRPAGAKLVTMEAHRGATVTNATGVSIYFPASGRVSQFYPGLDFSTASAWDELLVAVA